MPVADPGDAYKNVGSRTLQKLLSTPEVVQNLSPDQYSGMSRRAATARWSKGERIVFAAVQEGYTSLDSLPIATGLTETQVATAVASLVTRGIITNVGVESAEL